jgi:hypothetical protein
MSGISKILRLIENSSHQIYVKKTMELISSGAVGFVFASDEAFLKRIGGD